jgi:hypothetical protein
MSGGGATFNSVNGIFIINTMAYQMKMTHPSHACQVWSCDAEMLHRYTSVRRRKFQNTTKHIYTGTWSEQKPIIVGKFLWSKLCRVKITSHYNQYVGTFYKKNCTEKEV